MISYHQQFSFCHDDHEHDHDTTSLASRSTTAFTSRRYPPKHINNNNNNKHCQRILRRGSIGVLIHKDSATLQLQPTVTTTTTTTTPFHHHSNKINRTGGERRRMSLDVLNERQRDQTIKYLI